MTGVPDSLSEQAAALASGAITPVALAERALTQAQCTADLNAFVALDPVIVLDQARAAAERWRAGRPKSPIDGVPLAVKDNYLTRDYPTTACSNARPLEPAGQDATIVARLRQAGAVIFGKTNMHEWAYGATNSTSSFGPTRNPLDPDRITGGSSGGSAAAVAAGVVAAALGSDTGGSVRIPSAACGVYGFKPSYGRASRHGVLALSWSLDAPGPLTRALADIPLLLPYFFGQDPADTSTAHAKAFGSIPSVEAPRLIRLRGKGLECSSEVDQAISDALLAASSRVADFELDFVSSYFAAWEAILHCEASAYHAGRPLDGYTPVTAAHLKAGERITAVEFLHAQSIRTHFLKLLLEEMPTWDALVLPTLPVTAPRHGEDWQQFGDRRVTTQDSMTWFCWLGNLAGLPCVTIPVPNPGGGMPVGLMLMGKPGGDEALFAVAAHMDEQVGELEAVE